MKPVYRASFQLGSAQHLNPLFDEIAIACVKWAIDRPDVEDDSPLAMSRAETLPRQEIGNNVFLESLLVDDNADRSFCMRFSHRDRDDNYVVWSTELGLLECDDGRLHFSCSNYLGNVDGALVPMRRSPSRPRIVPDLLKRFGGKDKDSLSSVPRVLTDAPQAIGDFLDLLYNPSRRHPIVYISAANVNDQPVIDGNGVASWLAGLAHVFVAQNRFPSLSLRDRLPQHLNCWDGAVRIYWPGFRAMDPPFRHRCWSPLFVRDIERGPGKGFKEYLLGRLSAFAVFNVHNRFVTWNDILAKSRRMALARATAQGDFEKMAEEYAKDNDDLREQLALLHGQMQSQTVALEQARNEADSWREAHQQLRRGTVISSEEELEVPITSVAEAVERAEKAFTEKLVFSLNNNSEVEKNPFEEPQEVFSAFSFLATTYRNAKLKTSMCADFDEAIKNAIESWSYSGRQSPITLGKYPGWYQCTWNGNRYSIEEHIGTGRNKDPRYTIRVAFAWDSASGKVIIGFIGQHQKDDNT